MTKLTPHCGAYIHCLSLKKPVGFYAGKKINPTGLTVLRPDIIS